MVNGLMQENNLPKELYLGVFDNIGKFGCHIQHWILIFLFQGWNNLPVGNQAQHCEHPYFLIIFVHFV